LTIFLFFPGPDLNPRPQKQTLHPIIISKKLDFGALQPVVLLTNDQNPLDTFLCSFPGKLPTCCGLVTKKSAISWQQVVVVEFGKRRDTTDTMDFCSRQLITDLQRENWCNGFWENLLRGSC